MLFFSPLMTTVEEVYLKNYIYREPINILEELNDQIYETLATVIPNMSNMLRLARGIFNKTSSPVPSDEHLL
jgi:hypothetical protein